MLPARVAKDFSAPSDTIHVISEVVVSMGCQKPRWPQSSREKNVLGQSIRSAVDVSQLDRPKHESVNTQRRCSVTQRECTLIDVALNQHSFSK